MGPNLSLFIKILSPVLDWLVQPKYQAQPNSSMQSLRWRPSTPPTRTPITPAGETTMSITFRFRRLLLSSLSLRSLSSSADAEHHLSEATSQSQPSMPRNPKTRTPLEKQFETWIETLKPGFTCTDVSHALRSQSDPDLALDIFRWTAHQRQYKHDSSTYLAMVEIAVAGKRIRQAETLLEEVLAGACPLSLPLYNSIIRFCCSRRFLFKRAFDFYKKMLNSEDCKPDLETYTMLFNVLLRRFNKLNVSYVYLHAIRSLTKQMNSVGVIPDSYILNMIIKAYSKCLQVDQAIRTFKEMGLYGCEPNAYSYGYIVKGLCEKGRVGSGLGFYKEMRGKELFPSNSCFMVLICSLAMDGKVGDAVEVVFDMVGSGRSPDMLTYKTILEEMCRAGNGCEAFEVLEDFRKRDAGMNERMYKTLLNELHFISQE